MVHPPPPPTYVFIIDISFMNLKILPTCTLHKLWQHMYLSLCFNLSSVVVEYRENARQFLITHISYILYTLHTIYLCQGILKGEVSLYLWPPVWLVWNQLYDYWQFLLLFAKQAISSQSNRRSTVQWYFPHYSRAISIPCLCLFSIFYGCWVLASSYLKDHTF